MVESIKKLMDKAHQELYSLLETFMKEFEKDPIKSGIILEKLQLELERHFSIEELGIFTTFGDMKGEDVNSTFDLMEEHQEIMALLKKIETELGPQVKEDVRQLERLLTEHRKIEDESLYPRLDEELKEDQRKAIIAKIKEHLNT